MDDGIVFNVDTSRVLKIIASEIYDSPLALIRENLQNAYDAVRMRFARTGMLSEGGRIEILVGDGKISVTDNGIGMNAKVLRDNFWKAGSSGKQSDEARRAGVVGTFGIGAMANFGVCNRLTIETRPIDSSEVLLSTADRSTLRIGEECISLEIISSTRDIGTTLTATLDEHNQISPEQAFNYLKPYVSMIQVPIFFNGNLISKNPVESQLPIAGRKFSSIGKNSYHDDLYTGLFEVQLDPNGQILIYITDISIGGHNIEGNMALVQSGGQLMGLRSFFGLAPIPVMGYYQFGGYANLSVLLPTAGREALSRESIDHVSKLINIAERAASEILSTTEFADNNNAFLQWIISHNRYDLADKVSIHILPDDKEVPLGELKAYIGIRKAHFYIGNDQSILSMFANEEAYLLHIVQSNPRQTVQKHYIANILQIPEVPDSARVIRSYGGTEISLREAAVMIRIASILRTDYIIPSVEVFFADISHGVTVFSEMTETVLKIYIARNNPSLTPMIELYDTAYDLFGQCMKDYVRVHLYPRIQQYVPSSTKDGVDAFKRMIQRNEELYRYEASEFGDLEGLLGDFLSGSSTFSDVLRQTELSKIQPQTQSVTQDQIGSIENEVPGIAESPITQPVELGLEFAPYPPIIRDIFSSNMKILISSNKYPVLNNFTMLLGLSDRLMSSPEAEFLRTPHTTRIIWGGHRIIYIFTEAMGKLSLYYDIKLRGPLTHSQANGAVFPTTTLITKNRIFIPIPNDLEEDFRVTSGSKEFLVRFDMLSSDAV